MLKDFGILDISKDAKIFVYKWSNKHVNEEKPLAPNTVRQAFRITAKSPERM